MKMTNLNNLNKTINLNKIHKQDCLKFMRKIPDNFFDLVFADPPGEYDGENSFNRELERNHQKFIFDCIKEGCRIVKPNGNFVILTSLPKRDIIKEELSKYADILSISKWNCFQYHGLDMYEYIEYILTTNSDKEFVWKDMQFTKSQLESEHVTQLPLQLVKNIIANYTEEGDKIYDMFSGSGIFIQTAKKMGREFLATEVDGNLVKVCRKIIK